MAESYCPRCGSPMGAARREDVHLAACVHCAGVWLPHGELTRLTAAGPAAIYRLCEKLAAAHREPRPAIRGPLRCPACFEALVNVEHGVMPRIVMDSCHHGHGQWVTLATLSQIARELPDRPLAPPVPTAVSQGAAGSTPAAPVPPAYAPPQTAQPASRQTALGGGFLWHSAQQGTPTVPAAAPQPAPVAPPAPAASHPVAPLTAPQADQFCPSCGAANSARAGACWACGGLLHCVAAGVCPQCQSSLWAIRWGGVDVSACEGCNGVWLENGGLGALLMQSREMQDRLLDEIRHLRTGSIVRINPALVCFHCRSVMFAAPMGTVTSRPVHACSTCLTNFLPRGVLEEVFDSRRR